jgi:hypothetical protein
VSVQYQHVPRSLLMQHVSYLEVLIAVLLCHALISHVVTEA